MLGVLAGATGGLDTGVAQRLYITAGTKVEVLDQNGKVADTVKARDLAGQSDLLFRRDSVSGAVQCQTNKTAVALNEELHKHN